MDTGLQSKVVLVTGGGSGIGRASCLAFAAEGAKVVVADVVADGGEQTVSAIREAGGHAHFVRCDVGSSPDVDVLVGETVRRYGRLDCAHNNAGIAGPMARTADCSEQDWDEVVRVNLKGVWLCMRHEIAEMAKQHSGVIVNTVSAAGIRGAQFASAYAASSHAVVGLTRTAAVEYALDGIRVNAICPGIVDTPMIRCRIGSDAQRKAQFEASTPIGRMATAEEIAQVAVWLCSDAASYVTGHILVADGGRTA